MPDSLILTDSKTDFAVVWEAVIGFMRFEYSRYRLEKSDTHTRSYYEISVDDIDSYFKGIVTQSVICNAVYQVIRYEYVEYTGTSFIFKLSELLGKDRHFSQRYISKDPLRDVLTQCLPITLLDNYILESTRQLLNRVLENVSSNC